MDTSPRRVRRLVFLPWMPLVAIAIAAALRVDISPGTPPVASTPGAVTAAVLPSQTPNTKPTPGLTVVNQFPPGDPRHGQDGMVRAAALYAQHCAACHGEKGDGNGPAAKFLEPRPRNLRDGRYRMISSAESTTASLADLMSVLNRGMPGSSMPSWAHLPEIDRVLLIGQVLTFRREGARDKAKALLEEEGEDVTDAAVENLVGRILPKAGAPLDTGPLASATAESVARGRELFLKACAACHGKEGKGDGVQKMLTSEGWIQRPRDLTRGIFKGEHDPVSIYRRLRLGLPGSAMPANPSMSHQEVTDMVHFVLSLSDEATRQSYITRRKAIVAKQVAEVPTATESPLWKQAVAQELVAFPLWWRDFDNPHLQVQALHDGKTIAVRATWHDATCNDQANQTHQFEDMLALQLYGGTAEPFLGMGATQGVVDMWLWRASWTATPIAAAPLDEYPFESPLYQGLVTKGPTPPPDFFTARAAGNQHTHLNRKLSASHLEAGGFGTTTFRPPAAQNVKAQSARHPSGWTVVFTRPLLTSEGVSLAPGQQRSVAFALWDGTFKDRNGQKLITIWHDFILEEAR